MRLALWVLPSHQLLRYVGRKVDDVSVAGEDADAVQRISWAVRAAGRRVPRSTCLVEALSVQLLLARHGHRSDLRVGVAKDKAKRLAAHAWVEVNGKSVVGAGRGARYAVLPLPSYATLTSLGTDIRFFDAPASRDKA